ncbi:glycosyl hydrolase [Microbacterium sp. AGC85]
MTHGVTDIVRAVREGGPHAAPLMRWWWFSSHVSAEAIDADLDAMRASGIGGVEVSFVYPVAPESADFLSPAFLELVGHAARGAEARGMRFDLTLGAGWPFGGPHIGEDHAARRLHWERVELPPGTVEIGYRPPFDGDILIGAYVGAGSLQEAPASWERVELAERIRVPELGRGPRVLLVALSRLTGQNVKRAPQSGEGLVLDHYSAAAARVHLDAVAEPLVRAAGAERVHAGFCDSFEVYEADWTPRLPEEFHARHGYDLLPVLWMLHTGGRGCERLRADLLTTLTELFEEGFLAVFRQWASERGILFRAQCYGEPPMLTSSFRHVDLFEGEGWGWRRWTKNSWAVSAASAYGRQLVSSETWTWVRSPSFRAGPLDLLAEAYEHLLAGVNLIIGHGWPLGAALGTDQPVFYASGAIDSRNPWWHVAPELFGAIERVCAALQLGRRTAQVGVYHAVSDLRARAEGERPFDMWRQTRRFVDDAFVAALRTTGLDYDLVDDDSLVAGGTDRFEVILIPAGSRLTSAAEEALQRDTTRVVHLSEFGGDARDVEIREALGGVIPPIMTNQPASVGVATRQLDDSLLSLVVNTAETESLVEVASPQGDRAVTVWDAVSGAVRATSTGGAVAVRLGSYEGVIVAQSDAPLAAIANRASEHGGVVPLARWAVVGDGDARAVTLPHVWEEDSLVAPEVESLAYETEFELGEPSSVTLDFGDVLPPVPDSIADGGLRGNSFALPADPPIGVSARVFLDGVPAGNVWRSAFIAPLGEVRAGRHRLRVEVTSVGVRGTAAEAIDGGAAEVIAAHGVRHRVQDAAHRTAGIRSGILRDPVLRIGVC